MAQPHAAQDRFSKTFLILLALVISLIFVLMIRTFLVAILLAGIFSAMAMPLFRLLTKRMRDHQALSALATILIVFLLIVVPVTAFLGVVASQAVSVSQAVGPWLEQNVGQPDELDRLLSRIPFYERLGPYKNQIIAKVGDVAGLTGRFLVNSVAAATRGTVTFLLNLFIMLYAMFFFLRDGKAILNRILYYIPLTPTEENQMVDRFVSVTRATIKGTLVIGIIQGTLAGLGFLVAGIGGSAFWGTVMAVLSIIPGVGSALVWFPAVVFLVATGHLITGILLFLWCALIVGTVDNLLRPRLIGRDTKMSDLLVLLGTLGGILLFGAVGFVIGPIVAALFVTVWEIYGVSFKEYLPDTSLVRVVSTSGDRS